MKGNQIIPLFFAILLSFLFLLSEAVIPPSGADSTDGSLATCQACWVKSRNNLPDCAKVTDQEWNSVFEIQDLKTLSQTIPQVNGSMTCICSLIVNAQHILQDICAPCPYEMVSGLAKDTFTFASVFGCTPKGRSELVDNYVAPNKTEEITSTSTPTTTSTTSTTTATTTTTDAADAADATTTTDTIDTTDDTTDTTDTTTDTTDANTSPTTNDSSSQESAPAESPSAVSAPDTSSIASSSKMHHLGPMFIAVIAAVVFV